MRGVRQSRARDGRGGAGLGRATSLILVRAGADVALVDVNAAGLEETAGQVRALGAKVLLHVADLSEVANCRLAVEAVLAAFGRLDALCNVAAVMIPAHSTQMTIADYEKTIAVNLNAPFFLMQA